MIQELVTSSNYHKVQIKLNYIFLLFSERFIVFFYLR